MTVKRVVRKKSAPKKVAAKKPAVRKRASAKKAAPRAKPKEKIGDLHPKVQAFWDAAEGAGWAVAFHKDDEGQHLTCTRGDETLTIFWLNGVYQRWAEHWIGDGKRARVPNAKSGLRVLEASPEQAKAAATKKAASARRAGPRTPRTSGSAVDTTGMTVEEKVQIALSERTGITWDEESTDEEVLEMLNGKAITWVNSMSGTISGARILRDSKHFKMGEGLSGRYVDFCSKEGPFMAIALRYIVSVS